MGKYKYKVGDLIRVIDEDSDMFDHTGEIIHLTVISGIFVDMDVRFKGTYAYYRYYPNQIMFAKLKTRWLSNFTKRYE